MADDDHEPYSAWTDSYHPMTRLSTVTSRNLVIDWQEERESGRLYLWTARAIDSTSTAIDAYRQLSHLPAIILRFDRSFGGYGGAITVADLDQPDLTNQWLRP